MQLSQPPLDWRTFCARTNDPKLELIELALAKLGVQSRRNGETLHAPILEIRADNALWEEAWQILVRPIDDLHWSLRETIKENLPRGTLAALQRFYGRKTAFDDIRDDDPVLFSDSA